MAGPLGEDPDGRTVRQLPDNRLEHVAVLTHGLGVVLPAIDGDRTRRLHHPTDLAIGEEGCLGQEPDPATRHARHDDRVYQGVGVVRNDEHRTMGRHRRTIHREPVEGAAGQPAHGGQNGEEPHWGLPYSEGSGSADQSQAAPRTPLESPWVFRTTRVENASVNT